MSVLEVSREDGVLRLTLNRPEKKNALSTALCESIIGAVEVAWTDATVGCILLDARGDVFCAGMDLSEASGPDAVENTAIHDRLFTLGLRSRKPMVACVAGPALGGGLGLVANAHIVVAAHGCTFGLTEIRVGMWPFVIWRAMVAAIGERRTRSLALTGRIFSVNEAMQWALVDEIVPAFEVEDRASAIAHHIAGFGRDAITLGLDYLAEARNLPQAEAGRLALQFRARAFQSADYCEGVAAFREKRKPNWPR